MSVIISYLKWNEWIFLSPDPISDFQGQEIKSVKVAGEKYWVLVEVYFFRGFVW